ncbi:type VI secretion system tip protein VgrG [Fibrisoma montanum]|uniref:Type VI secretion system tip protein VgrG n=1 Tax=Fibrisoma montanum TaxID=2305895 RepID=A0A418MF65_9BACT|nr:type VI secretion system Vgr family protein [Fibrisoma montanum]RIV25434.1 type VI secretion system tip protein VgrG [Fibrisoma montanum]
MAQQVNVTVSIGGTKLTHFTSLRVDQSLFTHHTFEIVVPYEYLDDKNELFFKTAHQKLVGQGTEIDITPFYKKIPGKFVFKGIVTELLLRNNSELVNSYVIRGHSPTFLAEDGVQRRSFIQQTLGQIFDAVLKPYPFNKTVGPKYTARIDYKAQYDESNFDFLNRLAAEYGEWFYYDGQQLIVGKPGTQAQPFVIDGVQHFDMAVSLKPNRFAMRHYNYVKHEAYAGAGTAVGGLGNLGTFAYGQSQGLFTQAAQLWPLRDIQFQGELDNAIQAVNATNATDLVRFHGAGENPNLSVGTIVNVTGQKLTAPGQYKQDNAGSYRITGISHTVDQIGNYENFFEAVPDTAEFPPRNPTVRMPVALPEIATVIKNTDPLKLGRIQVQFHWPNQLEGKSSWIRVAFPYTGSSRGMLFIPEKDDQVVISYEANHVDFPIVVGSIYHKSPANDYWFDNNYQKIIRTKGGNKLVFKDKPGEQEIFITNANKKGTNFHISFKDDGVITLQTDGLIQLKAKDIQMTAKNNIEMKAQNNIEMTAVNEVIVKTKQLKTTASQKANHEAGQEIKQQAGMKVSIQAATIDVKGGGLVDIKAPLVKINS